VLGTELQVRPLLFRNFLVIFDRYYDDFFVDRRRYRLELPEWLLRSGRRLVRRPDVVIGLDASPELLQARKREVSPEECARQRSAYRELVSSLPNGHLVDASRAPEAIAGEICGIVLNHLATRTATRKGYVGRW
jgi:thymidylate kinase